MLFTPLVFQPGCCSRITINQTSSALEPLSYNYKVLQPYGDNIFYFQMMNAPCLTDILVNFLPFDQGPNRAPLNFTGSHKKCQL